MLKVTGVALRNTIAPVMLPRARVSFLSRARITESNFSNPVRTKIGPFPTCRTTIHTRG